MAKLPQWKWSNIITVETSRCMHSMTMWRNCSQVIKQMPTHLFPTCLPQKGKKKCYCLVIGTVQIRRALAYLIWRWHIGIWHIPSWSRCHCDWQMTVFCASVNNSAQDFLECWFALRVYRFWARNCEEQPPDPFWQCH